ncbi:AraC family transcriptional regulator [Allomuricauda sp. d1]|uniref:helix-turn-helix domain-containing protein n=1 Tax=Allomuricauda sp. d1 TaxID=3136725 RepID=UPI0031CF6139
MTFYENEIKRIKNICFSNDKQLQTVIAIRNFIDSNFDKELNLNFLSHVHFTSKYHLLRLFKRYYGLTPKQYLINKRIEKSKEYLKQGMSVSEVCYCVGFETPSSFSTLFKNKIGLSPTAFQKEQFSQSGPQ